MSANGDDGTPAGVRFGRTEVIPVVGDLLGQRTEAVVFPANRRGVMGAISTPGIVGLRSLGGSEIERQAMIGAPHELGAAVVTAAPGLEPNGINWIVHAVVHRSLGDPARIEDIRRGTAAAVIAGDRVRARTLALPLLGVESAAGRADPDPFVLAVVGELVAALRRSTLRYDRIVIACRFEDHAEAVRRALDRARDHAWVRPR